MRLVELSFELCRAQLARASAAGVAPLITSSVPYPLDETGKVFVLRTSFAFGPDHVVEFTLDAPCDLTDSDWRARFDAAVFGDQKWIM